MLDIPTCTLIVSALGLLLTAVVACVTTYIAWQQAQTAKQQSEIAKSKLRFELFNRRFAVFEEAMRLAIAIARKGICSDEQVRDFAMASKEARFLFDEQIDNLCRKLYDEALAIQSGKEKMEALPAGDERAKSAAAWGERVQWFNEQVDEMPQRFASFLKIRA